MSEMKPAKGTWKQAEVGEAVRNEIMSGLSGHGTACEFHSNVLDVSAGSSAVTKVPSGGGRQSGAGWQGR